MNNTTKAGATAPASSRDLIAQWQWGAAHDPNPDEMYARAKAAVEAWEPTPPPPAAPARPFEPAPRLRVAPIDPLIRRRADDCDPHGMPRPRQYPRRYR